MMSSCNLLLHPVPTIYIYILHIYIYILHIYIYILHIYIYILHIVPKLVFSTCAAGGFPLIK